MFYIATFYSHFGAIRFKQEAKETISTPQLMPVPRSLSSSCGTCVRFEAPDDFDPKSFDTSDIEQIVQETENGFISLYRANENQ